MLVGLLLFVYDEDGVQRADRSELYTKILLGDLGERPRPGRSEPRAPWPGFDLQNPVVELVGRFSNQRLAQTMRRLLDVMPRSA
jgi:hypothetical protein